MIDLNLKSDENKTDLASTYLAARPELVRQLVSSLRTTNANAAALQLYGVRHTADLTGPADRIITAEFFEYVIEAQSQINHSTTFFIHLPASVKRHEAQTPEPKTEWTGGNETNDPAIFVDLSAGYSAEGQANDILECGGQGLISKPFTLPDPSENIDRILRSSSART